MLNILSSFLADRTQRVTINGKFSPWSDISAGVPQGSVLGPLLFLIYINDLAEAVDSEIRIFADDTFIFHIVSDPTQSTIILNKELSKIASWAHQWKMSFNPDITKQAVEVIFSNKRTKHVYPPLTFNGIPVKAVNETKHLGLILDSKLSFNIHINDKLAIANQGIGLMKQLFSYVPRSTLEQIYKLYVRPHLDYGDVIYHIPDKDSSDFSSPNTSVNPLMDRIESIQYNAARVTSGAWKGTSRDKLYNDLGWESLYHRRNARRLIMLYDIMNSRTSLYLNEIIDKCKSKTNIRQLEKNCILPMHCRTKRFLVSFFPSTIKLWNNLDLETKKSKSLPIFKKSLLKKIRPKKKDYFGIDDKDGTRLITLLRLGLSPLKKHKFDHNFKDTVSPVCLTGDGIENTEHFLLLCSSYAIARTNLLQRVSSLSNMNINVLPRKRIVDILLYGDKSLTSDINQLILKESISYIKSTGRLEKFF